MQQDYPTHVNRWDVFEVQLEGTKEGNPFLEQTFTGIFTSKDESVKVNGFYDGDGIYKIRFMPRYEGKYTFVLRATFIEGTLAGAFFSDPAVGNNHGPVHVEDTYHFAYADGTPYISIGTTSYVWHLQSEDTKRDTLASLRNSPFNKIRFCIFPKHYIYNFKDPQYFPYEGEAMDPSVLNEDNFNDYTQKSDGNHFDLTRFNPVYFQNIEHEIQELGRMGIEADLILFHPYDRWGFSSMSQKEDELYLKYIIARFSAYHNVWWAMANEWDLFRNKPVEQWENNAKIIVNNDPYKHLRSIHNCVKMYDQSRYWITHVSFQRIDVYKGAELTDELREEYHKPVVNDELGYEGDLPYGWGNLTSEEMVRRFWETSIRGGYPGHSETYLSDDDVIFWSHGGQLKGTSYQHFGFLKKILSEVPGKRVRRIRLANPYEWDSVTCIPESEKDAEVKSQYIFYYSFMRPSYRDFYIDEETDYAVDVIDTWNMTIRFAGVFHGKFRVALPAKQYIAVRLRKAEESDLIRAVDPLEESVRVMQKHPFVEMNEEEVEVIAQPSSIKQSEIETEVSEEEYLEPVVVDTKKESLPFEEEEAAVEDDLDEEAAPEEEPQEEKEETKENELPDVEEELKDMILNASFEGDLELPEMEKDDMFDDSDELPAIVTGKIPTFAKRPAATQEIKSVEPVEKEIEIEEPEEDSLDLPPLHFFKKK